MSKNVLDVINAKEKKEDIRRKKTRKLIDKKTSIHYYSLVIGCIGCWLLTVGWLLVLLIDIYKYIV